MRLIFENPVFLWFLFAIPLLIIAHFFVLTRVKRRAIKFANIEALKRVTGKTVLTKNYGLLVNRIFIFIFLIFSVSGTVLEYTGRSSEISYVLAIDASSSMLAGDVYPTRLEAAKNAASMFVKNISAKTSIGIVTFTGISEVNQKVTSKLDDVEKAIKAINASFTGGTDLGEAIITSANLLSGEDRARVIILLTDGQSNVGVPIETAVEYANKNIARIHTIGIGTEKGGEFPELDVVSRLNEDSLINISASTGGNYYRAENFDRLEESYLNIISITKQKISLELAFPFLIIVFILAFFEWILINTKYRTLP